MKCQALTMAILAGMVACATEHPAATPTSTELVNARSIHHARLRIDAQFPPSALPEKTLLSMRVLEVSNDASLRFETGIKAKMEGIECGIDGVEKLRLLLIDKQPRVVFVPSTSAVNDPILGDVFLVEAPSDDSLEPSRAFTRVAESALLSGWCTPDLTTTSRLSDRYRALANLAEKLPPRN